ncbi:protein of unknown function [Klenkia soli]|uniref:DUF2382 domain-containing protein n=1 Tax=Klenkia soli TaxID=1052260 RepID=A0A1H0P5J7_9ACTN|nr:DUF2382 domain-containing protein [Klenkia soli]SDO99950.1 protein of unknown function [Klenkia soli]
MTSAPRTPEPGTLVLTAQQLSTTTEAVPVRRAVLRVETTTEQVMVPVTLTRQRARLHYVDVDPAAAVPVPAEQLLDGATGGWLVLTADEPVVTTRAVPVERVRLVTSWVTGSQDVEAALAHDELAEVITSSTLAAGPTA